MIIIAATVNIATSLVFKIAAKALTAESTHSGILVVQQPLQRKLQW